MKVNNIGMEQSKIIDTLETYQGLGRAPHPRGPLGHRLALIPLPKIHIYSKKISVCFYSVWTPFDMGFL